MTDIVLVSTADWDNPFWTNKQHVAVQIAALGHRVFYIESQGLRAPTVTGKDFRRIWKRLRRGLQKPREVRPNLFVWSPIVVPFHGIGVVRWLNRLLLAGGVGFWCRIKGIGRDMLWTYSPMTTELYDLDRYDMVVYHAVDDIKAQPGMPREAIMAAESKLSARADIVFTTAKNLQSVHEKLNPQTHYFSNVADYEHFSKAMAPETPIPDDLARLPAPRIGFVGAVSSYKLDFELIRQLALEHPDWQFVFVGEIGEGDPLTDSSVLQGLDNLHFMGGRAYKDLPAYLKGMDVVIQPNQINEYTTSMFPMKFFEYLAAGKPVVSTNLPALADYKDVAAFTGTTEAFGAAISAALAGEAAPLEARLAAAKEQTYEIRMRKMLAVVDAVRSAKAG